ncbi:hypothetical protein, partial [Microcoleus sp. OTE_8_concoct_300]|uniref:hypothetical protein n=1 Tax=Microcoleus sp. OTE_8_concoct_300 TaxID=2964710 RepID=UPI00403FA1F2
RPSFLDGRDAHPTNLWKLFNSHSLVGRVRQHRNFEFAAKIMQADAPYEYKPIYSGSIAW